jgi:hypothetical protein
MDPIKLTLEIFIPEPASNDIDELSGLVCGAIDKAVGEYDYVIEDVGMSFEIQDTLY